MPIILFPPEEIALAVMSEIVLVRRQGSGKRLRDRLNANSGAVRPAAVKLAGG